MTDDEHGVPGPYPATLRAVMAAEDFRQQMETLQVQAAAAPEDVRRLADEVLRLGAGKEVSA